MRACQCVSRTPFTSKRTTATATKVIIKSHLVNEEIVSAGLGVENLKIAPTNANVADGIRKATHSDEIRPTIRPWPLPPL